MGYLIVLMIVVFIIAWTEGFPSGKSEEKDDSFI